MRDEDGRALLDDFTKIAQDRFFRFRINAGQAIVQEKDFGIAQQGARNGGTLLLAAREIDASLPPVPCRIDAERIRSMNPDARRRRLGG